MPRMRVTLALTSAVLAAGTESNASKNCYEIHDSGHHYELAWKAQGHSFFDDMHFDTGAAATNGAAWYLDKASAEQHGVISTSKTRAKIHVGKAFNGAGGPRRYSASISTKTRYKHMLAVMKYKHVPFGLGVWPAFWMNGPGKWPEGGELDILEYASHAGQQVSLHTGASNHCKLSPHQVTKCTEMQDANGMGYDCYTNYGAKKLGCAPTTFAGQRPPEFWSENPGAFAIEWTDRFVKVYYFPERNIPDDLDTKYPRPENWDEKYVISYFPMAASNEDHPGWCPNPADVMAPQKIIMNIELCGDWAGSGWQPWDQDPRAAEWRAKRDRGECKVQGYHSASDCCTQYLAQSNMDKYIQDHAYFDIQYLKVFKLKKGPAPPPVPTARRRRTAPAPSPGTCTKTWLEDTDCDGADITDGPLATAEECCEWCGKEKGCTAFTHNVFDGHGAPHCYLKESCKESKRSGKRGCVSGTVHKAPTPPTPPTPPGKCGSSNYLDNTDCQGHDLKNMQKDSVDDCCNECAETEGCSVFVHNTADGHGQNWCYLKTGCKKSDRVRQGGCTAGVGILPSPGQRRRSRRRAPATKGCCSWADNNECGSTTPYCAGNAEQCQVCGGHWVPKAALDAAAYNESIDLDESELDEDEVDFDDLDFEDVMVV